MNKDDTQLRRYRMTMNLSISKLSQQAGVNVTTLSLAERRKLAPGAVFRRTLADFFGVPEDILFSDAGFAR